MAVRPVLKSFFDRRPSDNGQSVVLEARGWKGARLYIEYTNGRVTYASVGHPRSGSWTIGSGGLHTLGALRKRFHVLNAPQA